MSKSLFLSSILLFSMFVVGCQTLPKSAPKEPASVNVPDIPRVTPTDATDWGEVYTFYKGMSVPQLEREIIRLASLPPSDDKQLRQVLVYLVPHSPNKNTHQGRTDLRRWLSASSDDQKGLWYLVFDILTETTRLYERLAEQQQKNGETEGRLQQLEHGMLQLQQQIQQLTSIEQNIIDRTEVTNDGK
ncbi:hypothetical protein [Alteromonas sp. a30]|uniref:hypothetical protein n=1 Tax=Alteromonas sp. a30 TaxID=2730917 RepID=UPI002280564C|nr:hypothetical protein [Alteromonas sp. a30]MCY7295605.1 hypothetical protein [Alteromonas sp. a30]